MTDTAKLTSLQWAELRLREGSTDDIGRDKHPDSEPSQEMTAGQYRLIESEIHRLRAELDQCREAATPTDEAIDAAIKAFLSTIDQNETYIGNERDYSSIVIDGRINLPKAIAAAIRAMGEKGRKR